MTTWLRVRAPLLGAVVAVLLAEVLGRLVATALAAGATCAGAVDAALVEVGRGCAAAPPAPGASLVLAVAVVAVAVGVPALVARLAAARVSDRAVGAVNGALTVMDRLVARLAVLLRPQPTPVHRTPSGPVQARPEPAWSPDAVRAPDGVHGPPVVAAA